MIRSASDHKLFVVSEKPKPTKPPTKGNKWIMTTCRSLQPHSVLLSDWILMIISINLNETLPTNRDYLLLSANSRSEPQAAGGLPPFGK